MVDPPNNSGISSNFRRPRLLAVEDNDDHWLLIQRAMVEILPEVRLVRAANQLQAETLLAEWAQDEWAIPKLVLLDLYLPQPKQGWAVLAAIQQLTSPRNLLPVVLLSSSFDQVDINEAYNLGCASYLIKPNQFPDWLDLIRKLRTYWWETVTLPVIRPDLYS